MFSSIRSARRDAPLSFCSLKTTTAWPWMKKLCKRCLVKESQIRWNVTLLRRQTTTHGIHQFPHTIRDATSPPKSQGWLHCQAASKSCPATRTMQRYQIGSCQSVPKLCWSKTDSCAEFWKLSSYPSSKTRPKWQKLAIFKNFYSFVDYCTCSRQPE